jgi:hypothetical protein
MIAALWLLSIGLAWAAAFYGKRIEYRAAFKEGHDHSQAVNRYRTLFDEFKKQYAAAPDDAARSKLMKDDYWGKTLSTKIRLEAKSEVMGV